MVRHQVVVANATCLDDMHLGLCHMFLMSLCDIWGQMGFLYVF